MQEKGGPNLACRCTKQRLDCNKTSGLYSFQKDLKGGLQLNMYYSYVLNVNLHIHIQIQHNTRKSTAQTKHQQGGFEST